MVVHRKKDKSVIELFDLAADPYEKTNRAHDQPPRVAAMLKALSAQQNRDNDALPTDPKPKTP